MPTPLALMLNPSILPQRVIDLISSRLKHWRTGVPLPVKDGQALVTIDEKNIDIFYT
jgi:hypothetical protein